MDLPCDNSVLFQVSRLDRDLTNIMSLFSAREKGRLSEYQKWDYIVSRRLSPMLALLTPIPDPIRLHSFLHQDTSLIHLALVHRPHRCGCICRRHIHCRHPSRLRPLVQSDQTINPLLHFQMDLRRLHPLLLAACRLRVCKSLSHHEKGQCS